MKLEKAAEVRPTPQPPTRLERVADVAVPGAFILAIAAAMGLRALQIAEIGRMDCGQLSQAIADVQLPDKYPATTFEGNTGREAGKQSRLRHLKAAAYNKKCPQ